MKDNVKKAYDFFNKFPGHTKTATDEIADRLEVSYEDVAKGRSIFRDDQKEHQYSTKQDFDRTAEDHGVKDKYHEFLNEHNINPEDVVQVYYKGKATRTDFTVQTRFDNEDIDFDPAEAFKEAIAEYQIPDYSPKIGKQEISTNRAAMINLFDAHIDKICSTRDTDEEASIESNITEFKNAFDEILDSIAQKAPEIIYFPVGNDFFHTNDFTLTTKAGTRQDDKVHVTDMDAFRIGVNLLRTCIDKARKIAPIKIIPVRGNHDEDRVRYLLECLIIAYENQEDVSIIDTHKSRIYIRYGTWLFGMAHGDKGIKLKEYPSYMTTDKDAKKHWSDIKQGIFFLGHYHHEQKYNTLKRKDFKGVSVHLLRATSGTDSWHWEEGWTGIQRTAYGFIFDKDGSRDYEIKVNI